jgi:excisionase family DNA binding protein
MAEAWLTVKEAADYLKVSRVTLYRYMADGRLRSYKLGGSGGRRFRREDLDAVAKPVPPALRPSPRT